MHIKLERTRQGGLRYIITFMTCWNFGVHHKYTENLNAKEFYEILNKKDENKSHKT